MRKQKIHGGGGGGGNDGETHSGAEAQDRVEWNSHEVTYFGRICELRTKTINKKSLKCSFVAVSEAVERKIAVGDESSFTAIVTPPSSFFYFIVCCGFPIQQQLADG